MLRYHRRIFALYVVACALLGALRVFLSFNPSLVYVDEGVADVIFVGSISLNAFFFLWYMRQKSKRIADIFNNCFVEQFIWIYDLEYQSSKRERVRRFSGINLAAGLYAKGSFKAAANVLLEVGPVMSKGKGATLLNVTYFNNLGVAYAAMGEVEAAKECLDRIAMILEESNLPPKFLERVERVKTNLRKGVLVAEGDYENALKLANENGPMENHMIAQVANSHTMAVCYENLGEPRKARELYEFVAANGGDTYYAAEAKKKLSEISQ